MYVLTLPCPAKNNVYLTGYNKKREHVTLAIVIIFTTHFQWCVYASIHEMIYLCHSENGPEDDQTSERPCFLYAVIKEQSAGVTLNICATTERRTNLYTTSTNSVEISMMTANSADGQPAFFMVEFEGTF